MGKGIWKWKLQEGAVSGDTELFDQIVTKTIQFLSIRNDKKQFNAVPAERLFEEGQTVRFNVEVYNSVYERVTGQPFSIQIKNESDSIQNFEFFSNDQISEFSLLITFVAFNASIIGERASTLVQATAVITFLVSSYIVIFNLPNPIAINDKLRRD